ncbi:MAG: cysteine-rich CWC family protein [Ferruginibacter sp.]
MCLHEDKYCPRCKQSFECKVGNITQCQCYGVQLTTEERTFVDKQFNDCLCRQCLLQLKNDFAQLKNPFNSGLKSHR